MGGKILTQQGFEKLEAELEQLKTIKRKQVADRIKNAKEFGDLSENAEYQEAKEEQAFVEGRVLELESLIKTSVIVDKQDNNLVGIGSKIKVEKEGQVSEFTIVGSTEADPINGKISIESPLGEAFCDREQGEELEVELPTGVVKYKILEIN